MRPKIYLFGDSITEFSFSEGGWGAALINHFCRTADVVLRGYSGYNTRWALKVIERVFPAEIDGGPPVAVTVFFGANDACLPDRSSAFQHVPMLPLPIFSSTSDLSVPRNNITTATSPIVVDYTSLQHSLDSAPFQDLIDRRNWCLANLRLTAKEAEVLRQDNINLHLANSELNRQLSLL